MKRYCYFLIFIFFICISSATAKAHKVISKTDGFVTCDYNPVTGHCFILHLFRKTEHYSIKEYLKKTCPDAHYFGYSIVYSGMRMDNTLNIYYTGQCK